jgi:P27 family predicted phage terminase small subunit
VRGRRPKPTSQKILDGNPGGRRLNPEEPQPPSPTETFDEPPSELTGNEIASAEWRRLAPMLRVIRQVTEADRSALLALCIEWARYLDAMKRVADTGMVVQAPSGYPIPNPYLSIATKALSGCQKLWPELGLTPSSRSRVQAAGPLPSAGETETTLTRLQRQATELRRPVKVK